MKLFPELSFLTRRNGNLGDKSSITFSRDVISGIVQPTELPFYDWAEPSVRTTYLDQPGRPGRKCNASLMPNWELLLRRPNWLCSSRMNNFVVSGSLSWAPLMPCIWRQVKTTGHLQRMVSVPKIQDDNYGSSSLEWSWECSILANEFNGR